MQFDLDQFIRLRHPIQIVRLERIDMRHVKICAWWVLMLVLAAGPGFAQQPKPDEHHPGGAPPSAAMPGGPMGGTGEMPMMGMMRMMMGEDGMSGMGMMSGHAEGRVAFLK